jgi:dolichol-phosphate mannosyltransferase
MNNKKSITIVIPALNEENNIQTTVENALSAVDVFELDGEIIVVSDGSTDNTTGIVNNLINKDPRVKLIVHQTPQGIGASFLDGVSKGSGEIVVMIPGDNEINPLEALRYYMLLEHVDIVIPFVYNKSIRSIFRNALSQTYRQIINSTFRTSFHYTNGTVLYRKSILTEFNCNSNGFFFQTEILIKAVDKGYLFAEVPYRLEPRSSGKSKATSFRSFLNVCKGYFLLIQEIYFNKGQTKREFQLNENSISFERRNYQDRKK